MSRQSILVLLVAAAGCAGQASAPPPQERTDDRELRNARTEAEEATRGRQKAEAQLQDTKRELERLKKELLASRDTSTATESEARLSQDLLTRQAKAYEAKIAFYKNLLGQTGGKVPDDAAIASASTATVETAPHKGTFDIDAPVALIDGEPVARRELMEWLFFSQGPSALDPFIDALLAQREVKRLGIAVTDEEIESLALRKLALVVQQNGGDSALDVKLAQSNMTKEMLLDMIRVNERRIVYLEKLCLRDRETPAYKDLLELKAHQAFEISFGEKVEAKHFFIAIPEGTAEDIAKGYMDVAIKTREVLLHESNWAKVARETSTSANVQAQADSKAYYHPYFDKWPELDKLFFGTPDGEVSQPLRTKLGISIVQVEKRTAPTARFEDKREKILADLVKPEVSEDEIKIVRERLRSQAKVEKRLELR